MSKKGKILDTVIETVKGLHDIGIVDGKTMREFADLEIKPVKEFSPHEIKGIRLREKVSQPVLAKILNVSPSTIKKWETGENHPSGASLRLLTMIEEQGVNLFSSPN